MKVSETWGLNLRTELENGSWLERENSSFEIERAKKRIGLAEISHLCFGGGKKVDNRRVEVVHIFS